MFPRPQESGSRDAAHYNDWVKCSVLERLRKINYEFYATHGREFSSTRQRIQPGIRRLLETLRGDESVLDLGCGNGALSRELARRGHQGFYLGIDSSDQLLTEARNQADRLSARFLRADLLALAEARASNPQHGAGQPSTESSTLSEAQAVLDAAPWMIVAAFAVLHHIPGRDQRLQLLSAIRRWIAPESRLFLSNWQFLDHPRLKARIRPWSAVGVDAGDLDAGDYLLDWRHGTTGFRYAHQFDEDELHELAAACGFNVLEIFYSDGANHRSGLYEVWQPGTRAAPS